MLYGDADGNGVVNGKDSFILACYLTGHIDTISMKTMDIDKNGVINAKDANLLIRIIVG
ncbi:MAG: hypothetical protein IJA52_07665 [Clostridia bacterium]|nr:hypothetical protein [Clostridia bacterium]